MVPRLGCALPGTFGQKGTHQRDGFRVQPCDDVDVLREPRPPSVQSAQRGGDQQARSGKEQRAHPGQAGGLEGEGELSDARCRSGRADDTALHLAGEEVDRPRDQGRKGGVTLARCIGRHPQPHRENGQQHHPLPLHEPSPSARAGEEDHGQRPGQRHAEQEPVVIGTGLPPLVADAGLDRPVGTQRRGNRDQQGEGEADQGEEPRQPPADCPSVGRGSGYGCVRHVGASWLVGIVWLTGIRVRPVARPRPPGATPRR